ncbi:hypothetical protein [Aurantiacibacter gangjinensis]|uniref:Uncharacterized protein n=1 Tax=Aurantiacibacter gangjinensis TaxID=502682 RepID=A0A0G9MRJ5_9SPHN|nr:hypothetical protein [Aurantiacibacter gangjinensis]KLE33366.1 hypothetical protein AAW01_05375 [Aurantiacibacter gangjinensis]
MIEQVRRLRAWLADREADCLAISQLAAENGIITSFVTHAAWLASQSTRTVEALFARIQAALLTSDRLGRSNVPTSWSDQRELFNF